MTKNNATRPDVDQILSQLKDFQQDTVEYVFRRLYTDPDPVSRFLIADEVGLGKTLVARGVIAKAIDYLWDDIERIDVVYICSNLAIAQQNIDRLNITTEREFQLASRLTLLPVTVQALQGNKLNFVSLTPGTSFNLRSSSGKWKERAVLFDLLRQHWDVPEGTLRNILRGRVHKENWERYLHNFQQQRASEIDGEIQRAFYTLLDAHPELRAQYEVLADLIHPLRTHLTEEMRKKRNVWTGELRHLLAQAGVHSLEPDLVVLDEFQRFKHLLRDEGEISRLARMMFTFPDVKIILLSATPYKMYTLQGNEKENHYQDFLGTTRFLLGDRPYELERLGAAIDQYRDELLRLDSHSWARLREAKANIEHILRQVMVRTERLAVSADRNGMLTETVTAQDQVQPRDLVAFVHLDRVAATVNAGDQIEYWKSAAYPLNLMDDYKLKRQFTKAVGEGGDELVAALEQAQDYLLSWDEIQEYQVLDPDNARLRALWQDTVETGNWQLLWMPPALPYYHPEGPFATIEPAGYTKSIIFSAWHLVPKCIAMLLSYEAERRMLEEQELDFAYADLTERRRPLLNFALSQDRLTGMPVFCLIYPCLTLAREIDPLRIARELTDGTPPSQELIFDEARTRIVDLFQEAMVSLQIPEEGRPDESWYWAALALLDRHFSHRSVAAWLETEEEALDWSRMVEGESGASRFGEHVEQFVAVFEDPGSLGPLPPDLLDVLTTIALSSPTVAAFRALLRLADPDDGRDRWPALLDAAAWIGMGFRSLFNQPEAISLLQHLYPEGPYWQKVLQYSLDGNLQSVMDEYFHMLNESLGLVGHDPIDQATKIGKAVHTALSIRAPTLRFDEISIEKGDCVEMETRGLRCRYALRFGDKRGGDYEERTRDIDVRIAFNSPFRPFVLATTSIGQEGLDFHQYCHRVVHWNLPSNPVDLEQREGRVHRYKGHVIRRNVALNYGISAVAMGKALVDPWEQIFQKAVDERPDEDNDLVPFWVYEVEADGVEAFKIERRVPVLPLSREIDYVERLKKSLVAYRSVIGQPRQQELLEFLAARLSAEEVEQFVSTAIIDLSPPQQK